MKELLAQLEKTRELLNHPPQEEEEPLPRLALRANYILQARATITNLIAHLRRSGVK